MTQKLWLHKLVTQITVLYVFLEVKLHENGLNDVKLKIRAVNV